MKYLFLVTLCFSNFLVAATPPKIQLATNTETALASNGDRPTQSDSIMHVECILEKLKIQGDIRQLPWRRARQGVNSDTIDGFFTAVANEPTGDSGHFSAPLMLESWYWFWLSETPAVESWKGDHNLGVILGSQQESVLQAENYTNLMPANNVEQLIKQLYAKRVDAILVDQTNFKILAKQMQLKPNSYNSRFFRYVPLGVFFSSKFITQYPDFIGNFNKHIAACAQEPFSLTAAEKNTIKRVAIPYMYRIQHSSPVVQAVNKQNSDLQNKPQAQLLDIDKQWISAVNQSKKNVIDAYINRPASNELITIKQASKKLITEIIVMDARGFNVAISDISSDYWQGDESKYQDTINLQENELNIENINYDVSTKLFQVQASAPIIDTKANKNIGVITLGIDVERALSKAE